MLLTFSCNKPGLFNSDLVQNSDVEDGNNGPLDWQIVNGEYSIGWTGERYRSGEKSLTIQNNEDTTGSSNWILEIDDVTKLRKGKRLRLEVWIMTEDVVGTGFGDSEGIFFKIDGTNPQDTWEYTSLGNQLIVGSQDWTLYRLTTTKTIPTNTSNVTITLGMGAFTEGRVWFDDISLFYVNN